MGDRSPDGPGQGSLKVRGTQLARLEHLLGIGEEVFGGWQEKVEQGHVAAATDLEDILRYARLGPWGQCLASTTLWDLVDRLTAPVVEVVLDMGTDQMRSPSVQYLWGTLAWSLGYRRQLLAFETAMNPGRAKGKDGP